MNEKSKKTFRRKLVALGVMLAVLFGAIAVAGIVKRNDQNAVAYADEANTSEWEVVRTDYAFKGEFATSANNQTTINKLTLAKPSAKIENGNIVVSFTFLKAYDRTEFMKVPLYRNIAFTFMFDEIDLITVTKNVEYDFFAESGDISGVDKPQAGDVVSHTFTVNDFTSLTGCTSMVTGAAVTDIRKINVSDVSLGGKVTSSGSSEEWSYTKSFSISEVKHYALPTAPEKEGYRFTGWYTDEACTNKYTGETVTDDITLYAGYEKNVFTVTLNTDGETETLTVNYGETASLPDKTKTGYNFLGWYDESGVKYDGQAVTSDLTLTAKFEVIMLKVRFFVDDAEYKSVEVPYGSKFSEAVEKANIKRSAVKSVVLLASVAGEGEETPAEDQTIPEELTSDIKANVDVSALDAAKEQTSGWFKTTWEKIASFFVNLWEKISSFFAGAWEAVCNHFRNNWKWYAIGGGSAAGLAIVIAVICKVRR